MNTDHSMRASGRNFQDNRKRLEDRGYDNHRRSEDRTHDNHSRSEERIHNNHRRSKDRMQESMRRPEDRIRQDAVSRGAESGQIRSFFRKFINCRLYIHVKQTEVSGVARGI